MATWYTNDNSTTANTLVTYPNWNTYPPTTTTTTYTVTTPYITTTYVLPTQQEMSMYKTSVVALPKGYVGLVTVQIDGIVVPIARTKAFPFGEDAIAQAERSRGHQKVSKAAQKLALKLAKKAAS